MLTDTQCRTAKAKDKPYMLSDGKGVSVPVGALKGLQGIVAELRG